MFEGKCSFLLFDCFDPAQLLVFLAITLISRKISVYFSSLNN